MNDQLVELFFEGELFVEKPGLHCFEFPQLDLGIRFGFFGGRLIGLTACHDQKSGEREEKFHAHKEACFVCDCHLW